MGIKMFANKQRIAFVAIMMLITISKASDDFSKDLWKQCRRRMPDTKDNTAIQIVDESLFYAAVVSGLFGAGTCALLLDTENREHHSGDFLEVATFAGGICLFICIAWLIVRYGTNRDNNKLFGFGFGVHAARGIAVSLVSLAIGGGISAGFCIKQVATNNPSYGEYAWIPIVAGAGIAVLTFLVVGIKSQCTKDKQ